MRIVVGLCFAFVAFLAGVVGYVAAGGGSTGAGAPPSFADIAARVNPSVVHVAVLDPAVDPHADLSEEDPLDPPQRGEGSGFLMDDRGHVLTNHHVVNGASRIRIRLADRRQISARLLGSDARTDVALLEIEPQPGLVPIPLGDSDQLRVGEWVCAIGNPLSFDHSVTVGVVSSKRRKIWDASFDAYIQTDAAINPGNSGGPLLNARGEVVGISSAVSREGQGIAFAVPINLAREVAAELIATGRVTRGYLGVQLEELDADVRKLLGVRAAGGAMVADVTPDGTGARGGLRRYDVVTSVDGRPVSDGDDLVRTISRRRPGSKVGLTVWRDGREQQLDLAVTERVDQPPTPSPRPEASGPPPDALGLSVADLSSGELRKLKLDQAQRGVAVEDLVTLSPGGDALADGDLILEVNRKRTPDRRAYAAVVGALHPGDVALLYVYRPESGESFLTKLEVEDR